MKKATASILTVIIVLSCVMSLFTTPSFAATTHTLEEVMAIYPENHIYKSSFDDSRQCCGFARELCYLLYGSEFYVENNGNWTKYTDTSYIDQGLKAGDYVRYWRYNHSVVVLKVDGEDVWVADANWGNDLRVHWNRKTTKSALKSGFSHAYSAPYALGGAENSEKKTVLYQTATVTARSGLIVRSTPSVNSTSIKTLPSNSTVNVIGYSVYNEGRNWRKLLDGSGFVAEEYLNVTSGSADLSSAKRYKIKSCSSGYYLTHRVTGKAANDTIITQMEDFSGTSLAVCQEFVFTPYAYHNATSPYSTSVVYRISPASDLSHSLDIDVNNTEDLQLWENVDGAYNQLWTVLVQPDGNVQIMSLSTDNVLDIYNWNTSNGGLVVTYGNHGGANQVFEIIECP